MTVSVIIPAYRAEKYIEECLDSIAMQSLCQDNEYEILLGIDACQSTAYIVQAIRSCYKNLKVYWFPQNVRPYLIRNTLAYRAQYEHLIFFDADDIMLDGHIERIGFELQNADIAQYKYINFQDDNPQSHSNSDDYAQGVFGINADAFKQRMGGFLSWPCGADSEFLHRATRIGLAIAKIDEPLMLRRRHDNSLTTSDETGMGTETRKKYISMLKEVEHLEKIQPEIAHCEVVE